MYCMFSINPFVKAACLRQQLLLFILDLSLEKTKKNCILILTQKIRVRFFIFILFSYIFILLSQEIDQCAVRARLGVLT